jgi:hypothetical protein
VGRPRPLKGQTRSMSYLLKFIQQYQPSAGRVFLELEGQFQELERNSPHLPQGRRYQPISGGEPTNTLIWECECASLAEVEEALKKLADEPMHTVLCEQQSPYLLKSHTEIYKVLDL